MHIVSSSNLCAIQAHWNNIPQSSSAELYYIQSEFAVVFHLK